MHTFKCLIVDDEPPAHKILENYIGKIDQIELAGNCYSAVEAINVLKDTEVDIIFLDINMPELTGMEFLASMNNLPAVIMTTAYSDYALEGYEHGVKDYLMKPIRFNRFLKSIQRVVDELEAQRKPTISISNTAKNSTGDESKSDHIYVKVDGKQTKINFVDIEYLQAFGNYIKAYRKDKPMIMFSETMTNMMDKLPNKDFIRVHKSYIVNSNAIKFIEGNMIGISDERLPIGKSYKQLVIAQIQT